MRIVAATLLGALLASCSSGQSKQYEAVEQARSVLAEWATTQDLARGAGSPRTYRQEMRKQACDSLESAAKQLAQAPKLAAQVIAPCRSDPDAQSLRDLRQELDPVERSLEPA